MHRAEGRAARPGPSLPTWCKYRAKPRHAVKDSPRDARRTLNGILRTSRRLGVRIEDLGRVRGAQLLLGNHGHRKKAHDPDFLSAGILFALMVAVLAGVLAAMLVADPDRPADLPGNKSMGGGQDADLLTGASGANPDDGEVAEDVVEYLQHPRHQQQGDFILGYHDDYRERYDGFDQPPPFRQRHKPREKARPRPSDLEISEEEAFSTRVFVTTPRRQR